MRRGGGFKLQLLAEPLALSFQLAHQRLPAAFKKTLHPRRLVAILLVAAAFEAGRQAHLHLGINAAGKRRIRIQLEIAAPQLEEIERIVEKFLRRRARREGPVIARAGAPGQLGDAAGDVGARIRIFQIKFDDCREAQLEALAIVARKLAAQRLIKQEARFEI